MLLLLLLMMMMIQLSGAWAINSSPLVLSFDLRNSSMLDVVWPFISNLEVIAVNQVACLFAVHCACCWVPVLTACL